MVSAMVAVPMFHLCLRRIVENVVKACERLVLAPSEEEAVSRYVRSIPPVLANGYMLQLIEYCRKQPPGWPPGFSLRTAIHPDCTRIDLAPAHHHPRLGLLVLANLDVMPELCTLNSCPCFSNDSQEVESASEVLLHHIPKLKKLESLQMRNLVTAGVIAAVTEHCPYLEELDASSAELSDEDVLKLAENCGSLRNVEFRDSTYYNMSTSNAMQVLNKLPQIEKFALRNVDEFLRQCDNSYRVRELEVVICETPENSSLFILNQCFPCLKSLKVVYSNFDDYDLSCLNELQHLQTLEIKLLTPQMLSQLVPTCISRLTNLTLEIIESSFAGHLGNDVYPNMRQLVLYECQGVDIIEFGRRFPNLNHLEIHECIVRPSRYAYGAQTSTYFENLQILEMWHCEDTCSANDIYVLLSSPRELKKLWLTECRHIDDALLHRLIEQNKLKMLTVLGLGNCNLTKSCILMILETFMMLEHVEFLGDTWDEQFSLDEKDELRELQEAQGVSLWFIPSDMIRIEDEDEEDG